MVDHSTIARDFPLPEPYVGRFAPAPTGSLHFGSLITAVGSYLQALRHQGRWLLRIEDIDQTRQVAKAADSIQSTLEAFGFEWHGDITWQSDRLALYQHAIEQLRHHHVIFACRCSRAQIAQSNASDTAGEQAEEIRYPGTCRERVEVDIASAALRLRVDTGEVRFTDLIQGEYAQNVADVCGDFVIKRRDGLFAYHLAVVVDDADQGVTEVVRGADLLTSTPRQILLQRALSLPTPGYCHLPLAVDALGRKLSKSTQSLAIDNARAPQVLWQALAFLQQSPPPLLQNATVRDIWSWAREHWNLTALIGIRQALAPASTMN